MDKTQITQEMLQKIVRWTEKAESLGGEAEQFAREQAPLVVQEIITVGVWKHSISVSLFLILFLIGFILLMFCIRHGLKSMDKENDMAKGEAHVLASTVLGTISVIVLLPAIINIWEPLHSLLEVIFSPRLYVIQELKGLIG